MNGHLIFGIHGNQKVKGNLEFFRDSFKKSLIKCGNKIDVYLEGIYTHNINNPIISEKFKQLLIKKVPLENFVEQKLKLESDLFFQNKKNELNSLLYKGHFVEDAFNLKDILLNDPLRFNLIPEKQEIMVDYAIWKTFYLENYINNSLKNNENPILIVIEYLNSQVQSLFLRDKSLLRLLQHNEDDFIVLRGYLHSPMKSLIDCESYEEVLNDEILKAYNLFLTNSLDNNKLFELSLSYIEKYKKLMEIKEEISLEEYKKVLSL